MSRKRIFIGEYLLGEVQQTVTRNNTLSGRTHTCRVTFYLGESKDHLESGARDNASKS